MLADLAGCQRLGGLLNYLTRFLFVRLAVCVRALVLFLAGTAFFREVAACPGAAVLRVRFLGCGVRKVGVLKLIPGDDKRAETDQKDSRRGHTRLLSLLAPALHNHFRICDRPAESVSREPDVQALCS